MENNYYNVLGIDKNASSKELRTAYRRLARQYHPDVNPGDATAESRFKEINEAYQVLSDSDSRKKYDQFGQNWKHAEYFKRGRSSKSSFTWFNDARSSRAQSNFREYDPMGSIFSRAFGENHSPRSSATRPPKELGISITLEEAYSGVTKFIDIPPSFSNSAMDNFELKIPPGVSSGDKISLAKEPGVAPVDIVCKIQIKPHRFFTRVGKNLKIETEMNLFLAILGGEINVPIITGKEIVLKIPPQTQNGQIFKLKGKGMPSRKSDDTEFGDQMVTVRVVLPQNITDEQMGLFKKLNELN